MGLTPGSLAKILEIRPVDNGFQTLQLQMMNGAMNGQNLWLQYQMANSPFRFFNNGQLAQRPYPNERLEVTRSTPAYRSEEELALSSVNAGSKAVEKINEAVCSECELKMIATAGQMKDLNSQASDSAGLGCMSNVETGSAELCRAGSPKGGMSEFLKKPIEQFQIRSNTRAWRFHFRDKARQDMGITVEDEKFGAEIILIPRKVLPSVRKIGNELHVTLATGEIAIYDDSTGKIKSGVLSESTVSNSKAPKIEYSGIGVMIQVRGQDNVQTGTYLATAKEAVISKKGQKDCVVDPSELWPDRKRDNSKSHFKFAKDEDFDRWLKSKCGF